MNLRSLLLSSDDKTVRILRRVLSDLDIDIEYCSNADAAVRRITRQRYEAIIVDSAGRDDASSVLRGMQAAPVNKRAVSIVLVESSVGLKGGFEMGAHFVLHKPLAVERAKASFRAVRALMKRERRKLMRVPIQIPVECYGNRVYKATTIDLCEGGMAVQFAGRRPQDGSLHFRLELPGTGRQLDVYGELAWEGDADQVGVRFKDASDDQLQALRGWLNNQLAADEPDDPPVACQLTDLSLGGCYLKTGSPFPRGTRVVMSIRAADLEVRADGIVLVAHSEIGMGIEFLQTTAEQRDHVLDLIKALRTNPGECPDLQVEPRGLEASFTKGESSENRNPFEKGAVARASNDDALLDLFRQNFQIPADVFLQQLREQRQTVAHSS